MANLTTAQFVQRERKRIDAIKKGIPIQKAAIATNSMQVDRIFGRGIKSNGSNIGAYDTSDPLYVNPNKAPRSFPPKGKTGQTVFLNGKPHKTGFFPSYSSFRNSQGRQTGKVDLVLSASLKNDYATPPQRRTNTIYIAGVTRPKNGRKLKGAENRYGKIFALTKDEQDFFVESVTKLILNP